MKKIPYLKVFYYFMLFMGHSFAFATDEITDFSSLLESSEELEEAKINYIHKISIPNLEQLGKFKEQIQKNPEQEKQLLHLMHNIISFIQENHQVIQKISEDFSPRKRIMNSLEKEIMLHMLQDFIRKIPNKKFFDILNLDYDTNTTELLKDSSHDNNDDNDDDDNINTLKKPLLSYSKKNIPTHHKSIIRPVLLFCISTSCILYFYMIQQEWGKAHLFVIGSTFLKTSGVLISQAVPMPDKWNFFLKLLSKATLAATISIPAQMLFILSRQIGNNCESTVTLPALNALSSFSYALFLTEGEVLFFNQPFNWPNWLGLICSAITTSIQIWHAIEYPEEYYKKIKN